MNAKRRTLFVEAGLVLLLAVVLAMSGGIANALTPTVGSQSNPVGDSSAPVGDSSAPVGDQSAPIEDPGLD